MKLKPSMHFTIKKLNSEDTALAKELFLFFQMDDKILNPTFSSDEYVQNLLAKDDFHVIVALHDGIVIGGITAYELTMYKEEVKEMFLYELAVEATHRRNGIARGLIEFIKEYCASNKIKDMFVGAVADNLPAVKLYKSTGGKKDTVAWFVYEMQ